MGMALPSGFSTTLSNPIGIRLVLLGLVVMLVAVLILVFDVDRHEKKMRNYKITPYFRPRQFFLWSSIEIQKASSNSKCA